MYGIYHLLRPFMFLLDAEVTHNLALEFLKWDLLPHTPPDREPNLRVTLTTQSGTLSFPNPIGLAAGFDKQAEVMDSLLGLGFGSVEVGTITPLPQPGNPRPRLFRLPQQEALINRFGFNSDGSTLCLKRLEYYREKVLRENQGVIGINVGKNKDTIDAAADYVKGVRTFADVADYLTVNLSSPNTPGLRDLQRREPLSDLLKHVLYARDQSKKTPPLFVKISPDLDPPQIDDIIEVIKERPIDGLIISNTTTERPHTLEKNLAAEMGGLSGRPLMQKSTKLLSMFYRSTEGKLPLIGCGGIANAEDAYQKIRAGASLVQLYTAFIYQGPTIAHTINHQLAAFLKRDGFHSIQEAIGTKLL